MEGSKVINQGKLIPLHPFLLLRFSFWNFWKYLEFLLVLVSGIFFLFFNVQHEFQANMPEIKKLSVDAFNYLTAIPVSNWSRHGFSPRAKSECC